MAGRDLRRTARTYTDPAQHAALACLTVWPLAARSDRQLLRTAVIAALLIDVDHAVAARSVRPSDTTALDRRPPTHSLLAAAAVSSLVTAFAGGAHGWACFAALASHLLHDAGDRAAPTPVLWPFRPAAQLGRRVQLAGTGALIAISALAALRLRTAASGGRDASP